MRGSRWALRMVSAPLVMALILVSLWVLPAGGQQQRPLWQPKPCTSDVPQRRPLWGPKPCTTDEAKPVTTCRAYFTVLETDEVTVGIPMLGLNKPQLSWYQGNGNKGKFAGICYLDLAGGRMSVEEFISREKSGAIPEPDAPLYVIAWGEYLKTQTYVGSYETWEHVNGTDANGNATGANVPVTHTGSRTKRYYVADGVLMLWQSATHDLVRTTPLHNHNRTVFTSASTSLLKDGLEAIEKRLDSGTP